MVVAYCKRGHHIVPVWDQRFAPMMPSTTHGRTFIVKPEPVVRGIVVSLCNASVAFVSFLLSPVETATSVPSFSATLFSKEAEVATVMWSCTHRRCTYTSLHEAFPHRWRVSQLCQAGNESCSFSRSSCHLNGERKGMRETKNKNHSHVFCHHHQLCLPEKPSSNNHPWLKFMSSFSQMGASFAHMSPSSVKVFTLAAVGWRKWGRGKRGRGRPLHSPWASKAKLRILKTAMTDAKKYERNEKWLVVPAVSAYISLQRRTSTALQGRGKFNVSGLKTYSRSVINLREVMSSHE